MALLLLAACMQPQPQPEIVTERYHDKSSTQPQRKPLNGLQLAALASMNNGQYDAAIASLQRAIKIEPRDPLNWHYLAQNYWFKKDFPRCREMIQRSRAYGQLDPDLERANLILRDQCSE